MRTILRIASVIIIGFVFTVVYANGQGAVKRDFSEICQDTVIPVGGGVFEGGHWAGMPNWLPSDLSIMAVVSRDDFLAPQSSWDCSNDIVSGSVTERMAPGQGVTLRQMNLQYEMPLEVWTYEIGVGGVDKILDNGFFEAAFTRKMIIANQGDPLNMTCIFSPRPCGSYSMHIAGEGIAFGTGEGDFYEGQMVRVNITQTFVFQRNRPNKEFPNWDNWPVENVILTPIN